MDKQKIFKKVQIDEVKFWTILKKNLRNYINNNNFKQKILCDLLNLQKASVSELLNGERDIDLAEYWKICVFFGVSFESFLPKLEDVSV